MKKEIKMIFECEQDWGQMKVSGKGRHCELCCKTVYDFSSKSSDEILRAGSDELCGMFLRQQIEPDLRPIEAPFSLRAAVLTIATFLGLELSQVHAQDSTKVHKIESTFGGLNTKDSVMTMTTQRSGERNKNEQDDCEQVKRPRTTRYYFSKRFPFFVKRRIMVVGRFRH